MMRNTKRLLLVECLALTVLLSSPVFAQAPGQNAGYPDAGNTSVAVTMYKLLTSADGQQFYMNRRGQAVQLPGAGCADNNAVAVYTGNGGEMWYVDRTGRQVDIEPFSASKAGHVSYYSQPYETNAGPAQPPSQASQTPAQQSSGSSSAGSAMAAGLGAAAGSIAGSLVGDLMNRGGGGGGGGGSMPGGNGGGIPYGQPTYPPTNGQPPYYMGQHGQRVYINNVNENHMHQWNDQHRWYNHEVNNDDGRYHKNSWPGKENGFPRPGEGGEREYATNPAEHKELTSDMNKPGGLGEKQSRAEEQQAKEEKQQAREEKQAKEAKQQAKEEKHSKAGEMQSSKEAKPAKGERHSGAKSAHEKR